MSEYSERTLATREKTLASRVAPEPFGPTSFSERIELVLAHEAAQADE
jgi:hypothetical protein